MSNDRTVRDALATLATSVENLIHERDEIRDDREGLRQERNAVIDAVHALESQRDAEIAGTLALRRECMARESETLGEFVRRLREERDAREDEVDRLKAALAAANTDREALNAAVEACAAQRDHARRECTRLRGDDRKDKDAPDSLPPDGQAILLALAAECEAGENETTGAFVLRAIHAVLEQRNNARAELARWKDAEAHRGHALAAVARERDAYSEEAERVAGMLRDVRLPGENTLQALARVVVAYERAPRPLITKGGPA